MLFARKKSIIIIIIFFNFNKNCSLGIVGKDMPFTIFDDDKIEPYLNAIEGDSRGPGAGRDDQPGPGPEDDDKPRPDPQVNVLMESMEH